MNECMERKGDGQERRESKERRGEGGKQYRVIGISRLVLCVRK